MEGQSSDNRLQSGERAQGLIALVEAGEMLTYKVVAQGTGGVRYGHKERAGIYLTDSAEGATAFQSRAEAQEFAEELTDLHQKSGLSFEVKEN